MAAKTSQNDSSVLAIILARAGSKGLPRKNMLFLAGKPMIAWTIEHAQASRSLERVVVSTDGPELAQVARSLRVPVIDRPAELAGDTATVDDAARHALAAIEQQDGKQYPLVVILYANIPIRPSDLTDRAVAHLRATGADSVQSVCPVGKMHPFWMKKLSGPAGDVLEPYVENQVYRRQDLPAVHMLDGGLIAVRREALQVTIPGQPHAFLGRDRRAILTQPGEVVDVDTAVDLQLAEMMLTRKTKS